MTSPKSKEQVVPEACASTPWNELERQIMDPNIPKNEREWWAAGEIARLRERDQWQPISEHKPLHSMQQILCGHSEGRWIRFGFYEPVLKRWYYSGTSERWQWAQVEDDAPTHFMPLPTPPKGGEE